MKKPDWTGLHRSDSQGIWTPFLAAASTIYGLGLGLRPPARPKRLPGFVLSVGNIVAGGTGKTPAVVMLARWVRDRGHHVAVLSRGYRGSYRQPVLEVSAGGGLLPGAHAAGDEPCLLAESLPGIAVVVGRERYHAGLHARARFGSEVFILDDGFQHRKLARDLDLVLMDAGEPWGNGHLLPRGPLREPLNCLERADAVVLTRAGTGNNGARVRHVLRSRGFSMPLFLADHVPACVVNDTGEVFSPEQLDGQRVAAFAGIGNPASFRRSLESLGALVVHFEAFPDHHGYSAADLAGLDRSRRRSGADRLITTEKDWMRIMSAGGPCPVSLSFLRIEFSLLPGSEGLLTMISEGIEAYGGG